MEIIMLSMMVANTYSVQYALWIMVQGMLGIFVFMTVFYLLIYALELVYKPKEPKK